MDFLSQMEIDMLLGNDPEVIYSVSLTREEIRLILDKIPAKYRKLRTKLEEHLKMLEEACHLKRDWSVE